MRGRARDARRAVNARRGARGSAVALALMLLLVLSLGLAVISIGAIARLREAAREIGSIRLTAGTDAALAETLAELARSADYEGAEFHDLGGVEIASEVQWVGTLARRVTVHARLRGPLAGRDRRAVADVLLTPSGPWVSGWRRLE